MKRTLKEFVADIFEDVRVYEFSSDEDKKYVMISNFGLGASDWYGKYKKEILRDLGIKGGTWNKKGIPISIAKKMDFSKFNQGYNLLTGEDAYTVTFPLLTKEQQEKKDLQNSIRFDSHCDHL